MKHVLFLALALPCVVGGAQAAVFQVPGDHSTLLAAADAAVEGDSILVAPGTYTDRETREINGERIRASAFLAPGVTIVGTGGAEATIVLGDAPEAGAINALIVPGASGPETIALDGLTLRGGDAGLSGLSTRAGDQAALSILDCVLEECGIAIRQAAAGNVELVSTIVRNNTDAPGLGVCRFAEGEFLVTDCSFEDNVGRVIDVADLLTNRIEILQSSFLRNGTGSVLRTSGTEVQITESHFEGNDATTLAHSIVSVPGCNVEFTRSLFVGNTASSWGVYAPGGHHEFSRNTFYGNECTEVLHTSTALSVGQNVFAETSGAAYRNPGASRGCNVFWNTDASPDYSLDGDIRLDPEFCDPLNGDFRVAASSPCLEGTPYTLCGPIGRFGEGCPSTGRVVHLVQSDPQVEVLVDGEAFPPFVEVQWTPGTTHTIGITQPIIAPGTRWGLDSWSDGGDVVHEVTAQILTTNYVAAVQREHLLTMELEGCPIGEVWPGTRWLAEDSFLGMVATAHPPCVFVEWTGSGAGHYAGPDPTPTLQMIGPITQVAHFEGAATVRSFVGGGEGRVVPEQGTYPIFSDLTLRARAEKGWRFVEWKGQGEGSYTGRDNPVTITLEGDVEQAAYFEPVRFDLGLSLSRFNANAHEGGPIGFGDVHLWLTCASGRRVQEVEVRVQGTMDVLAFVPAPGMVSQGTNPVTVNTGFCRWAATRLGHFIVDDPEGGILCLDTSGDDVTLQVRDCSNAPIPWPQQVSFIGINTAGGDACSTGTGCINQIEVGPEGGDGTIVLAGSMRIGLNEVFPNPFTGETTIRYAVSRPQVVRVVVYDVSGRRVSVLRDAPAEPGVSSIRWNGRDAAGSRVASGVYFVRMQSEEATEARKIIRLSGR